MSDRRKTLRSSASRVSMPPPPSELQKPILSRKRNKETVQTPVAVEKKSKSDSIHFASRAREEAAWTQGFDLVVGCDEAGRGPLAGPVVAAACALPANLTPIPGVGDSKAITDEADREALYERIISSPGVKWSARVIHANRIDDINILMGSLEAMRLSIVDVLLDAKPERALALIDGPFSPWKEGPCASSAHEPVTDMVDSHGCACRSHMAESMRHSKSPNHHSPLGWTSNRSKVAMQRCTALPQPQSLPK